MSVLPTRRTLLTGMTAAPLIAAYTPVGAGYAAPANSLKAVAQSGGRYYGAAVQLSQIESDGDFRETVLRDCSCLTPEIHLKWDLLQPRRGAHEFGQVDRLTAFAARNGMRVRGHTLLWDQSTPQWAKDAVLQDKDWSVVADHFAAVLQRYEGKIQDWDVINEPLDIGEPDDLRVNTFMKAFGPGYIRRALEEARAASPTARLALNDYGFDYDNPIENARRRRFLILLEQLKAVGAPIDQVGIQAHLDLSRGPADPRILRPFLQSIADMGLDIVITELDVKEEDYRASVATRDRRVADEVTRYMEVALAQPAVKGVITWGLTDRHSWLQHTGDLGPGVVNRGLPFDSTFSPKPMYWAMRDAFAETRAVSYPT